MQSTVTSAKALFVLTRTTVSVVVAYVGSVKKT
jgi:hypothetical protein